MANRVEAIISEVHRFAGRWIMSAINRKDIHALQPVKTMMVFVLVTVIAGSVHLIVSAENGPSLSDTIPADFKIAFISDTALNSNTHTVLQLIKDEGADMVLHQGDIDNAENGPDSPIQWDQLVTNVLGADFPFFAVIGNHDVGTWDGTSGFQALLQARLDRIPDAECIGELGVQAACSYKGFFFIQSGVGTRGGSQAEHADFIEEQFAQDDHIWHICSWHKNMQKMQLGEKSDETGWGVYEACREAGAIIATGHEHSYGRTYLMASFSEQIIQNRSDRLVLRDGQSFAFHGGLGGFEIRDQNQDWPWFAVAYTSDQDANYGALFCTFNDNGQPNHASCYFKDITGLIADQFELVSDRDYNPAPSFIDVPASYPYFAHIEKLFELGYVAGVSENPRTYGLSDMLREHMSVYITRGVEGADFIPTIEPTPIPPFDDVAEPSIYSFKWIDWLKKNGFTSGCNPEGTLFCPIQNQTMAEYSVYLYRMLEGADAMPPEPTAEDYARFTDLPHDWRDKWLAAGWKLGFFPHCDALNDGRFALCPDKVVDRGIAAYMLVLAKAEISTE
jgi:3',5'-cyclic AMP phosphodiesterase CpdA